MASEVFQASRWTKGNFLFPTRIEVADKAVIRRKRSWFSVAEISISMHKVASVHITTGILWSDLLIESSGGSDPLTTDDVLDLMANGLTPEQVIEELPDLEIADIQACLRYASRRISHPVLVA